VNGVLVNRAHRHVGDRPFRIRKQATRNNQTPQGLDATYGGALSEAPAPPQQQQLTCNNAVAQGFAAPDSVASRPLSGVGLSPRPRPLRSFSICGSRATRGLLRR
jgi:hypothetical protein